MSRPPGRLEVFGDAEAMSIAAAARFAAAARDAARESGRFVAALSGGRTPRRMYELLAAGRAGPIDWDGVHLFWGDERYVPHDHPQSNFRMAREALLDAAPIPAGNVHPMPVDMSDPEEAARLYEMELRDGLPGTPPRFDLVILGLGADGHVASLFPDSAALRERTRRVLATRAPFEPSRRLSITLPVIEQARHVIVLAEGAEKERALGMLFGPDPVRDDERLPASLLHPQGDAEWLVSGVRLSLSRR